MKFDDLDIKVICDLPIIGLVKNRIKETLLKYKHLEYNEINKSSLEILILQKFGYKVSIEIDNGTN